MTAATLPRSVFADGEDEAKVVIVGLTCALELADREIASTVYEASGRIGGRMFTNTGYWNAGQISEWGGELIDSGHTTIRKLAQRFGLPLDNLLNAQPPLSEDLYHFFGDYYPKSQAEQDFLAVFAVLTADAAATGSAFANAGNSGVVVDATLAQQRIEPVYPGLSWNGKATPSLPHKSSLFRASYSFYKVGQYTTFGGYEKKRQGGVLFCGEHTATNFQGFMEGGASEGKRAAKQLARILGKD